MNPAKGKTPMPFSMKRRNGSKETLRQQIGRVNLSLMLHFFARRENQGDHEQVRIWIGYLTAEQFDLDPTFGCQYYLNEDYHFSLDIS
jgi:hypothetical protein